MYESNNFVSQLDDLVNLCKEFGMHEDLVQAGGGNISVKNEYGYMCIKASGCTLFEVDMDKNFKYVSTDFIKKYIEENETLNESEQSFLIKATIDKFSGYPSIETFIHSLTKKYTVHLHPISTLAISSKNLAKLFPESVIIKYIKPGFNLARYIYEQTKDGEFPSLIFLEKHGVIITADTLEEVIKLAWTTIDISCWFIRADRSKEQGAKLIAEDLYKFYNKYFYVSPLKFKVADINYSPDYVIYKGKIFIWDKDKLKEYSIKYGRPSVIDYYGDFYVVGNNFNECKKLESVFNSYKFLSKFPVNELSDSEVNELMVWDSEKYRRMEASK